MTSGQTVLPESLCSALIAPCGMDCGLCRGYVREKNRCAGCNGDDSSKPRYCADMQHQDLRRDRERREQLLLRMRRLPLCSGCGSSIRDTAPSTA